MDTMRQILNDPQGEKAELLQEGMVASGLYLLTFITTSNPLLGGVSVFLAGVGTEWTAGMVQKTYEYLFREDGLIDQDIAWALTESFKLAVKAWEVAWKDSSPYNHLLRNDPSEAEASLIIFEVLEKNISTSFQTVNARDIREKLITQAPTKDASMTQGAAFAIVNKLDRYLEVMSPHFREFMRQSLGLFLESWVNNFKSTIINPGAKSDRAWRASQILWNKTAIEGLEFLKVRVDQTHTSTASDLEQVRELLNRLISEQQVMHAKLESTPIDVRIRDGEESTLDLSTSRPQGNKVTLVRGDNIKAKFYVKNLITNDPQRTMHVLREILDPEED